MIDVQRHASAAVCAVLSGRNLDQFLARLWRRQPELSESQRAAIKDLSFGTLRHYGTFSAWLAYLLDKPLTERAVHCLLVVALYQLIYTKVAPHAVVDHAVNTAATLERPQTKALVNAVLRNFLRRRPSVVAACETDPVARFSYPSWWIDKVRAQNPERWSSLLAAGNEHPPMTLRVNVNRTNVADYLALIENSGLSAERIGLSAVRLLKPISVRRLAGFQEGLVSVQDLAAQYAAPLLDVRDGLRVLDACGAPGGKTGHLLEISKLDLTAIDKDPERLKQVRANLERLGLAAKLLVADAAEIGHWWDGKPFDRILLDAPCSASGAVKRHPDIKWLRRPSDIASFAQQQAQLLDALWQALARGGKLLYVTCSIFREENQAQVDAFQNRHRDAASVALEQPAPWNGQIVPDALHDGFFYALLQKR